MQPVTLNEEVFWPEASSKRKIESQYILDTHLRKFVHQSHQRSRRTPHICTVFSHSRSRLGTPQNPLNMVDADWTRVDPICTLAITNDKESTTNTQNSLTWHIYFWSSLYCLMHCIYAFMHYLCLYLVPQCSTSKTQTANSSFALSEGHPRKTTHYDSPPSATIPRFL